MSAGWSWTPVWQVAAGIIVAALVLGLTGSLARK